MLLNLSAVAPGWAAPKKAGKISEASPPEVIQQLKPLLDKYQPQVSIVSPRSNEVLDDNTVSVKFNVKDLPLYKDQKLGLGPHLHVFLDDQPYQAVYDVSQPVVFKDLAAGTHTIRALAGRPWHESFKNDGAFAQVTFHVFTKTPNNNPDPKLPLLTYSRPQATYGAEPVLLDFYLTNAPLHIVAQEDDKDDVADWRVKVTVNGDSFTVDRWQPIYLKGFKPGKNWVQLEYIDEKGNSVPNVYNNTARVFNYEPNGQDTLSKLVRGEISFDQAVSIVEPNYKPAPEPVAPTPEPTPVLVAPLVEEKPEAKETPKPVEEAPKPVEAPKAPGGFFNRFKHSEPKPTPEASPEPEKEIEAPTTIAPEPEAPVEKPKGGFFDRFKRSSPPVIEPSPEPEIIEEPTEEPKQPEVITPVVPVAPAVQAPGGFFNRFKRPNVAPVVPPVVEEEPSVEPSIAEPEEEKAPEPIQTAPEVEEAPKPNIFERFKRPESKAPVVLPSPTPIPDDLAAPEAPAPVEVEPVEVKPAPEIKETPKSSIFDRLKRPESKPSIVPPDSTPAIETPVEIAPSESPIREEKPPIVEEPAPSDFEPQTELERRLGMPLKPRISQPVTTPEPALSSESAQ
ncbi:hypothetical protein [Leptolyngbya sp. NIES-2104]|uniref:hypothetical protein n=1 Tax=Leptolyngbya sp. NIES-2104 TaxID=1552121 RepID=UPI0012E39C7F|nr:hypothetical protein [Leptolyngbya sp. NIES-2104]